MTQHSFYMDLQGQWKNYSAGEEKASEMGANFKRNFLNLYLEKLLSGICSYTEFLFRGNMRLFYI